ncbi:hypothetical protein EBT11_04165 [bacterium]|nr:hypothetical protein [bacterium]
MPKVLKYKKGFTIRHHLDELCDRLDCGFKIKVQGFIFLVGLGVVVGGLVWANQRSEKREWLEIRDRGKAQQPLSKVSPVISEPSLRTETE